MHDVRAAPYPDIHVLASHRAIDDASDDDCWERDAECDLGDERACGSKRGAGDEWAGVVVDYDGDGHVEGDGDALFEEEGFLEVARVFELGLEGEKGDVTGYIR